MTTPRRVRFAILVASLLLPSVAFAQEWSRFRGPNGSGVNPTATVPATWTSDDYRFAVPVPGRGHSSPVLWSQRLFLVAADPASGQRTMLCYDALTGEKLWSREFPGTTHKKHRKNSFATSTPAVDAERVYACWAVPERITMVALSHDGDVDWEADLGSFKGGHGFGTSPVVVDDLVVLGNDQDGESSLIAVERDTGRTRWTAGRHSKRTTYSTPCLFRAGDRPAELIFTNWQHGISSIDPRDGSLNWETAVFGKEKERAIGSPIVAGELVIGSCGFVTAAKHVVAVRPYPAGSPRAKTQVEEAYRIERAVPHVPTPLVHDDLLFLWSDAGIVTCLEVGSGRRLWQKRVGGAFSASPVCASGRLYSVSEDGEVVVLAAGREYQELGRMELGETCFSTPAVALDTLYIRTSERLIAVGGRR